MTRRRRSRWHRDLMDGYYASREAWEQLAESVTFGYDAEMAEFIESNPRPTFREYLIGMRQERSMA